MEPFELVAGFCIVALICIIMTIIGIPMGISDIEDVGTWIVIFGVLVALTLGHLGG